MEPFKLVTKISSRSWVVLKKKDVLKNIAKFTKNHLCQNLILNKLSELWTSTLFKKRLWRRNFPVHLAKFLITPFLQNTTVWLLQYKQE